MTAHAILGLVALCALGCFTKPPAPLVDDARPSDADAEAGDDARRDAGIDGVQSDADPSTYLCDIQDDFAGNGPACGMWGTAEGAEVSRELDRLVTKPTTSEAGCVTQPIVTRGVFSIHLDQVGLATDGDYVYFDLVWPGVTQITTRVNRTNGNDLVEASCNGADISVPYSANDHRHLRYVMSHSGSNVSVALIGSDGTMTATPLVNCSVSNVATRAAYVRFGTGSEAGVSNDVASYWDTLSFACDP